MPTSITNAKDWRALKASREAYRQLLIAKGVVDGGSKMMSLMARKYG